MDRLTTGFGDFAANDGLRSFSLFGLVADGAFLLGHVPLVDVDVEVLQPCVDQHKHESEEHQGEVSLGCLDQHSQGAKLRRVRQAERDDDVAEDVEQSTADDEEEHPAVDQVRGDHDLHVAHDDESAEDELAAHENATEHAVLIRREAVKREVSEE